MGLFFNIWTYFLYSLGVSCTNISAIFPFKCKCTTYSSISAIIYANSMPMVVTR